MSSVVDVGGNHGSISGFGTIIKIRDEYLRFWALAVKAASFIPRCLPQLMR
jgi:hypothetical protein